MKRILLIAIVLVALTFGLPLSATTVIVGIPGAGGTIVTGTGASFATSFAGQTVVGNSLTGLPTGPLTLVAGNMLDVEFFNGSNSILPEPGNQGPLSMLLDQNADSLSWTMGHADSSGPITIAFYDLNGALVSSISQVLVLGYHDYTVSGIGTFRGVSFFDDIDPAGLRFQNFSYNANPVPEPGSMMLLGTGLIGAAAAIRRRLLG